MASVHRLGRIPLTANTAAHLDAPIRRALRSEDARRAREGSTAVNLSRHSVSHLIQVGPERTAQLSRYGVYTIGDFARLDAALVPAVLAGAHAAMRKARS